MRNRLEPVLRILSLTLAALLVGLVVRAVLRSDPLAVARIPSVPRLATNATNTPAASTVPAAPSAKATNSPTVSTNAATAATAPVAKPGQTNPPAAAPTLTNGVASGKAVPGSSTNVSKGGGSPTNSPVNPGSNSVAAAAKPTPPPRPPGPRGGAPGALSTNLPPLVRARIEKVVQSEILAPIMRPMPMALLGIAGSKALLRAPNGMIGFVKEGEPLGDITLVRIGTNRVLIEHEKTQKELMIFSGFGSESLLPKSIPAPQ